MSASLVGSEMCIRDRDGIGARAYLDGRRTSQSFTHIARPARGATKWAKPVSYTHLTLPTICSV
eukprot:12687941-Alexandrium_andersonii.AAC.1